MPDSEEFGPRLENMSQIVQNRLREKIGTDASFWLTGRLVAVGAKTVTVEFNQWPGSPVSIDINPDDLMTVDGDDPGYLLND